MRMAEAAGMGQRSEQAQRGTSSKSPEPGIAADSHSDETGIVILREPPYDPARPVGPEPPGQNSGGGRAQPRQSGLPPQPFECRCLGQIQAAAAERPRSNLIARRAG